MPPFATIDRKIDHASPGPRFRATENSPIERLYEEALPPVCPLLQKQSRRVGRKAPLSQPSLMGTLSVTFRPSVCEDQRPSRWELRGTRSSRASPPGLHHRRDCDRTLFHFGFFGGCAGVEGGRLSHSGPTNDAAFYDRTPCQTSVSMTLRSWSPEFWSTVTGAGS